MGRKNTFLSGYGKVWVADEYEMTPEGWIKPVEGSNFTRYSPFNPEAHLRTYGHDGRGSKGEIPDELPKKGRRTPYIHLRNLDLDKDQDQLWEDEIKPFVERWGLLGTAFQLRHWEPDRSSGSSMVGDSLVFPQGRFNDKDPDVYEKGYIDGTEYFRDSFGDPDKIPYPSPPSNGSDREVSDEQITFWSDYREHIDRVPGNQRPTVIRRYSFKKNAGWFQVFFERTISLGDDATLTRQALEANDDFEGNPEDVEEIAGPGTWGHVIEGVSPRLELKESNDNLRYDVDFHFRSLFEACTFLYGYEVEDRKQCPECEDFFQPEGTRSDSIYCSSGKNSCQYNAKHRRTKQRRRFFNYIGQHFQENVAADFKKSLREQFTRKQGGKSGRHPRQILHTKAEHPEDKELSPQLYHEMKRWRDEERSRDDNPANDFLLEDWPKRDEIFPETSTT